jgi:hypothetical protein
MISLSNFNAKMNSLKEVKYKKKNNENSNKKNLRILVSKND